MKISKITINGIKELSDAECKLVVGGHRSTFQLVLTQYSERENLDGHHLKRPKKPVKH